MKKYYPESELIINSDGSVFHLHLKPEFLADKVILVGDPGRVALVASHFDEKECDVESREFHTITGSYKGKRITVLSTGIGCDNIDIVVNELDALANIDFETRTDKDEFRQLTMVRIGTCGGLQEACRNFHLLKEIHGIRRTAELLCRKKCGVRPADRKSIPQPHGMDRKHVSACAIRG